jgi:hypothetical protein
LDLWIHCDDDQIAPIAASADKTAKIVKGAELKVYKGGSPASPKSIPRLSTRTYEDVGAIAAKRHVVLRVAR